MMSAVNKHGKFCSCAVCWDWKDAGLLHLANRSEIEIACDDVACERDCQEQRPALRFLIHEPWGTGHLETLELGMALWPAGLLLAQWLAQHREEWWPRSTNGEQVQCRVLELGCGCACLPSMVAARMGADVVATDLPEILACARRTVALNTPKPKVTIQELQWGDEIKATSLAERHGGFHVVFAADILYTESDLIVQLVKTITLLRDDGRVPFLLIVAYQHRSLGESAFMQLVKQAGFVLEREATADDIGHADLRRAYKDGMLGLKVLRQVQKYHGGLSLAVHLDEMD